MWLAEQWLREMEEGDEDLVTELQLSLPSISNIDAGRDEVFWVPDEANGFSVKGCASEICKPDGGSELFSS